MTAVPRRLARELGLEVAGRVPAMVGLERTRVRLELEGKEDIVPAVISDVIDKVLIGVTALEILRTTSRPRDWEAEGADNTTLLTIASTG